MLYKGVEPKEGVLVQYVGVHVVRWRDINGQLDKPTVGFIEADEEIEEAYLAVKTAAERSRKNVDEFIEILNRTTLHGDRLIPYSLMGGRDAEG